MTFSDSEYSESEADEEEEVLSFDVLQPSSKAFPSGGAVDEDALPLGNAINASANEVALPLGNTDPSLPLGNAADDDTAALPLGNTVVHLGILDGENLVSAGERIVPLHSLWATKDELKETLTNHGLTCGFKVCSIGWSFTCNKAGASRDRSNKSLPDHKRRKGNRQLKVGCKMCVKFTYVDRLEDDKKPDKAGRVRVTFTNYSHTSSCIPSANQLVVCRKASGDYSNLSEIMVNSIIAVMEHDPGVSTRALRAMLLPAFPKRKAISSLEIYNVRVRVRAMIEEKVNNGSLQLHKDSLCNLFKGLDDDDSDVIDNASRQVQAMLRSVLASTTEGWKLKSLLEKMHAADSGFTYRVSYDKEGGPTGFVWMTPHMRSAFELYGNFISIDAMKRQQNCLHWPYIGPVILDEGKTIANIAESIVCMESLEAYEFVLQSIFEMAPGRHKSRVQVIAADCFVTPSLLASLGISATCRLMWDHYHILESIWPTYLGPHYFAECKTLLSRLLNAHSEQFFDETIAALSHILSPRPDFVSYILGWAKDREYYAQYLLDTYPGSMGRRGSQSSEANHSSFLAAMGSGLMDEPAVMFGKTVLRQNQLNVKRNERIATYNCKSSVDTQAAIDSGNHATSQAIAYLSSWGVELWSDRFNEALKYECLSNDHDSFSVQRLNSDAPCRAIPKDGRCDCNNRVAFLFPCCHEICAYDYTFDPTWVDNRWKKRNVLTSSAGIGDVESEDTIDFNHSNDDVGDKDGRDDNGNGTGLEGAEIAENPAAQNGLLTQQSQMAIGTGTRKKGFTYLMSIFTGLAQDAAGSRFEDVVAGVALQMQGAIKGHSEVSIGTGEWDSMVSTFGGVLETYKNSFSGVRNGTSFSNVMPTIEQRGKPESKRYISVVESQKNVSQSQPKKRRKNLQQTCGFCNSLEHQRSTCCPLLQSLGKDIIDVGEYHSYLLYSAPYSSFKNVGEIPLKKTTPTETKHIIVHRMFSTFVDANVTRPRCLDIVFEATILGAGGIPLPNFGRVVFEGQAVFECIFKLGKMKGRHVFSTVGLTPCD